MLLCRFFLRFTQKTFVKIVSMCLIKLIITLYTKLTATEWDCFLECNYIKSKDITIIIKTKYYVLHRGIL
jgi:hypothetical protein